ncbi:uncharacterized protein TM35_000331000 [Trypanosoma theileri]|uniref:Uncharacterized protein n=1 Tax=Trypanosoma theileri TaxID=67003 RepID=A0A1X0NMC4_9TRYP|nr:uncharacterized protein TM35_000331000 [Trypanosoma theileri]ORC85643.1 hypothetical protein TM35_000331000 [Trypanosoma theileri]
MDPWRQQADKYIQRRDVLKARAKKPEIRPLLQQAFVERMKSNNPFSQEVSFILMTLLYSGDKNPHIMLADMLLNMSAKERFPTHNWWVYRNANEILQDSMSKALASDNLIFPLFPGRQMDTQNRCLIEDAMGAKRLADMGATNMEALQFLYPKSRALFAQSPPATNVLSGGEPFIPVLDGNNNQAGYWDGAPVKERFDQLQKEIQSLRSAMQRFSSANNGSGTYAGKANGSNRRGRGAGNAQRGGRRSGRGGGYNYQQMYGGDASDDGENMHTTNETIVQAKNGFGARHPMAWY